MESVNTESRTKKSVRNSTVSLFFYAVDFVLKFYSRKIFLDYLGAEILGLNTTAINILQFLNLAELGIGPAITFVLYKPLREYNYQKINEIVTLQGMFYKRIACVIITGAVIIMCFFPLIFAKITIPLWYAYATFGVMLFSSMLGYFVNYRSIVLTASQMDYKLQMNLKYWGIISSVLQMLAVAYMSHPYEWWLGIQFVFSIISAIALNRLIKKVFPNLKVVNNSFKELKHKYFIVLKKSKQAVVHNIAGYALGQLSPVIIYAYATLTLVAVYGNYMTIVNGIVSLVNAVFNSIGAGIGDLVAEGNKDKILSVFKELFSIRFLIGSVLTFDLIVFANPLICLWIGAEYLLDVSTVIIIASIMHVKLTRLTVQHFIYAYGLYHDTWAPVAETCLNVGLSVLLGYLYGLNGILGGVLISVIVIPEIWKPYFLFKEGLKVLPIKYFILFAKHFLGATIIGVAVYYGLLGLIRQSNESWLKFLYYGTLITILYTLIYGTFLWIVKGGIELFIVRVGGLVRFKYRK